MKHTTFNKMILFLVLGLAMLATTSCAGSNLTPIEGTQRDELMAKVEPVTANVFDGLAKADYDTFSVDFDPTMLKAMDKARFDAMVNTLDSKIGKYQSCEVDNVGKAGLYYAINYKCKFEKEDNVAWRIVLSVKEPHLVSGLWYDSPKLRQK